MIGALAVTADSRAAERYVIVAPRFWGWVRVSAKSYEFRTEAEDDRAQLFERFARVVPDHPGWWR